MRLDRESLDRFVEALDAVRKNRAEALDAHAHRKIAEELGFGEDDLRAAEAEGEAELARGEGFLRHGLSRQAAESLRRARALLPDRPEVLGALAKAELACGRAAAAVQHARRCIEVAPTHEPAFEVLAAVERAGARRPLRALGAVTLLCGLAVGGALGAGITARARPWPQKQPSTAEPPRPRQPPAPPVVTPAPVGSYPPDGAPPPVLPDPGRRSPSDPPAVGASVWDGQYVCANSPSVDRPSCDVPLVLGSLHATVSLDTSRPFLSSRHDGPRLTLVGSLRVASSNELSSASAELVQLDAAGKELDRTPVQLLATFEPTLRPTDTHAFFVEERAKPGLARALLRLVQAGATPAPSRYPQPTALTWSLAGDAARERDLSLDVSARSLAAKTYDGESSLEGVLAVTNRGARALKGLVFDAVCVDPAGVERDKSSQTPVYSHMPPMLPGETRAVSFSCYGKGPLAARPRIRVTEVER